MRHIAPTTRAAAVPAVRSLCGVYVGAESGQSFCAPSSASDCPECRDIRLRQLRDESRALSCGSNCCVVKHLGSGGIGTNGPCDCGRKETLRALAVWREYALLLETGREVSS